MEEMVQRCEGCRWKGDIYCWHPVLEAHDDLAATGQGLGKKFDLLMGGVSPVWCPGKEGKKVLKERV